MKKQIIIFLISLSFAFFFRCGGKYEPDILPQNKNETTPIEREKEDINYNDDIQIQLRKSPVKIKTENQSEIFQRGIASWYGGKFHGRRTANGEVYDKNKLTAAHKTLPFNSIVEVTNLDNNKKVIVRINDRGPFVKNRIIDLSRKAAKKIGMEDTGTASVSLRILNKEGLKKLYKTDLFTNNSKSLPNKQESYKPKKNKAEIIDKKSSIKLQDDIQWYYIQAGAFKEKENAKRLLDKISRVSDVKFIIVKINGLFKVKSIKLSSKQFAEEISSDLKEYYIDCFVKSF